LKEYLVAGYSVNENRLLKNYQHLGKLKDLIETIEEAQKEGRLKIEDSDILMKLISEYSKSFTLFNEIDSDSMTREGLNTNIIYEINYDDVMEVVAQFKGEIERRGETNNIFGLELENRVKSSIGAIAQTFDGKYLYPSIEEQSANLLYMIVSGHAFKDGNKRNGSLLFLWFLEKNNYRFKESGELKFNDNAIVLLSLLIAKSRGQDKDKEFYIDLIINLLKSRRDNNFKSGGDISYKKKDKNELNEIDWLITG
jgi:death-on-curing family protein